MRESATEANAAKREQLRETARAKRAADPERYRAYGRKYRAANPDKHAEKEGRRRAQKRGQGYEKIIPAEIYERDGGHCHICGKHVPRSKMSLDHLVPLSRGGSHTKLNVRLAHVECNVKRGAGRTPAQLLLV